MIQVLNRALNILEFVARHPQKPHSLTDISNHLDINPSTCANIIKTLVSRNYLEQISKKEGYRLGNMSYYLTNNFSFESELIEAAKQPMKELSKITSEGCILSILRGNLRIIIHEEKSSKELQVINHKEKNAYNTSTGRMILSHFSEEELKKYAKNYGLPSSNIWDEVQDIDDLIEKMSEIKDRGIATQESVIHHILGIAVPIMRKNEALASVGIYMPSVRLREDNREIILNALKTAGEKINRNLEGVEKMHVTSTNESEIE